MQRLFKVGDRVKVAKNRKAIWNTINKQIDPDVTQTVHTTRDMSNHPYVESIGHPQWITTDYHPELISGAWFRKVN